MPSDPHFTFTTHPLKGWTYKKLIDCTSDGNLSYGIVQPGTHIEGGIPIVRVNNVNNGQLRLDDVMQVSPEIENKYKRTRLEGGEVLLTLVGSAGQSVVVPKELAGWNIARAIAVVRPKPEIGANWINICLQTREVQQFLDERANTTVQKTLNLGDVRELPIPIPPTETKKQIEDITMALGDKICINRQINQTLEQMALATFKSWFVDFEPVKSKINAKAEGRDPERVAMCAISGKSESELEQLPDEQRQQLAATAALFPDEFEESELGLIPKFWEYRKADEISDIGIGKTPPRKEPQWFTEDSKDVRWVSIRDMGLSGAFMQDTAEYLTTEAVSRFNVRVVPDHTVLLSFKLTVGRVVITDGNMVTNEAIAHFKLAKDSLVTSEYLYLLLKQFDYASLGSTSSIADAVNSRTIREMPILVPTTLLLEKFTETISPLFTMIRERQTESVALENLRDALLPKFLSGELLTYAIQEGGD